MDVSGLGRVPLAFGTMGVGIVFLPVDGWTRGFLAMGQLFTVNACFTLAKTCATTTRPAG